MIKNLLIKKCKPPSLMTYSKLTYYKQKDIKGLYFHMQSHPK